MIVQMLAVLLSVSPPIACPVPESMPEPSAAMAGTGDVDWCMAGEDVFAALGPDAHPQMQLVASDPGAELYQILQWRRGEGEQLPPGWRDVFSRPGLGGEPGMFEEILFQRFGEHIISVTRNRAWRIGNAVCAGEGGPTAAYLPQGVTPSAVDSAFLSGFSVSSLDDANIMCTSLIRDGDSYALRFHGPHGRALLEVDDFYQEMRARVTAPGDYETHLGITQ